MQVSCILVVAACLGLSAAVAQDPATFITYTHQSGDPGNLGIGSHGVAAPVGGRRFLASATEFDYGICRWCSVQFYVNTQAMGRSTGLFTGFRWENRLALARGEHWINPVLFIEFEDLDAADKGQLEVVGQECKGDLFPRDGERDAPRSRQVNARLVLGKSVGGWMMAGNFIAEKNLAGAPVDFGYSAAVTRQLSRKPRKPECALCSGSVQAGVEAYGGLGTQDSPGFRDTSQYVAALVAWSLPNGVTLRVSPGFGLTQSSVPFLLRVGVSSEIAQIGRFFRRRH